MRLKDENIAILYRTYWSLMLSDILHKLGFDATRGNKMLLHEFHKRILNYKSIAGASELTLQKFLLEVTAFWANHGIFVRTNVRQELGIEDKPLKEIWDKL